MISVALRNLTRNRWRTRLTVAGVAVAVAMLIWSDSMMEGFLVAMIRSATAMQLGDARIETVAHADRPSIYESFPLSAVSMAQLQRIAGVRAAAPRLETFGLVGHGTRSQVAAIIGVDPEAEASTSEIASALVTGRWLTKGSAVAQGPKEIVLGATLADLLSAKQGDELVVLLQAADGSMGDDRVKVIGIARTGTTELDRQAAWMRLPDVAWLAALEGQAHEIVLRFERGADVDRTTNGVRAALAGITGDPKLVVRSWQEIVPDLHQMVELSRQSMVLLYFIIYFVAALGILNTQRMTALERRREFGVMMAVGMTPRRLAGMVILESVLLTTFGAILGMLLGWGISAWHAHAGLDLAAFGSEGFSYQGVTFTSRIHFVLTAPMVVVPPLVVMVVGAICGLWPAVASARLDAARAIAGRT
jgi:ABC-type lipoprotein release transport system permease subunit